MPKFQTGFDNYLSVFSFRYGSEEMRQIWSQQNYWLGARKVWLAVAEAQNEAGLVTKRQLSDLKKQLNNVSVERIFTLEKETGHDIAAAIKEYSEKAPLGGTILHQAMTSEDVLSNAEILLIKNSFDLIEKKLIKLLEAYRVFIKKYKDLSCMGYTHLQAAEPTTIGYRFAKYAQDSLYDLELLRIIRKNLKAKGIRGPVGTSAALTELLVENKHTVIEVEQSVMQKLGLKAATITDQTYPRKFLFQTETVLANIASSLHRFALDIQLLQSSNIDEVSEPRRTGQVGSSAMPHKQNPIQSENIDALTETVPGYLNSAWICASFVTLERTLRDSAGKRSWLPESFLVIDESISRATKIMTNLKVHEDSVRANFKKFAPFCATEAILAQLTNAGMDRKKAHELLVRKAEIAVKAKRANQTNPLRQLLLEDTTVMKFISFPDLENIFNNIQTYTGNAGTKCQLFLTELQKVIIKK